jgi:hypothetical protein
MYCIVVGEKKIYLISEFEWHSFIVLASLYCEID